MLSLPARHDPFVMSSKPEVSFPAAVSTGSVPAADIPAAVVLGPGTTPDRLAEAGGCDQLTPAPRRSHIWDVPFDCVTMDRAVDHIEQLIDRGDPSYVITANLNYAMLHHQSGQIRRITEDADLVLADGQPIVWRSKFGPDPLPERVAGSELIYHLAERASQRGHSIYFLGGQPGVAALCAQRIAERFPGLKIAAAESPPFRELSAAERAEQAQRIRKSGASLLLVAFGQPKGERWIHENYKDLGVPVSIQLGASFDFIAGTAKRAPRIWQRLGVEWLYRMLSDPRRLVPRYAANAWFLLGALCQDLKRIAVADPANQQRLD